MILVSGLDQPSMVTPLEMTRDMKLLVFFNNGRLGVTTLPSTNQQHPMIQAMTFRRVIQSVLCMAKPDIEISSVVGKS